MDLTVPGQTNRSQSQQQPKINKRNLQSNTHKTAIGTNNDRFGKDTLKSFISMISFFGIVT
jgi:hypothetical protein